jgi:ABC-type iron transport system FetAB permease component
MSGLDPVLVQYQVFAQRRLHFGQMFWANIAFMIVILIVIFSVASWQGADAIIIAMLGLGTATIQMAYIAHRLRKMEDQCEQLMHEVEVRLTEAGHLGVLVAPRSGRFSARSMAVLSLAALGMALVALGVYALSTYWR